MTDAVAILALDTGTSELEQSMLTYTVGFGTTVRIPRVMWVIQGPTTVVVDTSVPTRGRSNEFIGEDFSRPAQEPANALRDAGVDPKDVEPVVLTHLHWDHAGNCDLFPDARVLVQQQELRYAVAPGPLLPQVVPGTMSAGARRRTCCPTWRRSTARSSWRPGSGWSGRPATRPVRRPSSWTPARVVLHRGRRHQHLRQHRAGHPARLPCGRGRLDRLDGPPAGGRRPLPPVA